MKKQREEQYWSKFAQSYDTDGEYVVGKRILQAIKDKLLEERCLGNVIEFGCGAGYFTKSIARNARHVNATDLSDEMLKIAALQLRGLDNVTIQKADCANTPFLGGMFDTVFMANLIHVVDNPSQCLQESHRILRDGGSLIVLDFTSHGMGLLEKAGLVLRYLKKWGLPPRHSRNDLSPDDLVLLVESAGFEVEHVELMKNGSNALYLKARKK